MATSNDWKLRWQESDRRFYWTINGIRLQWGLPPISHPSLQAEDEELDRTILVKIHLELYPIPREVLEKVFSGFGIVEYLEVFGPRNDYHSKIRFHRKESAIEAFDSLNHRNIYDRCCRLELFLGDSVGSSSSKQERVILEEIEVANSSIVENFDDLEIATPIKIPTRLSDGSHSWSTDMMEDTDPSNTVPSKYFEVPNPTEPPIQFELSGLEINKSVEEPQTQHSLFQVNSEPSEFIIYGGAIKELFELVKLLIELMEIRVTNSKEVSWTGLKSIDCVPTAYKVFVKMSKRKFRLVKGVIGEDCCLYLHRRGSKASNLHKPITWPFDRGRASIELDALIEICFSLIVDQGGVCLRDTYPTMDQTILVFDPGGLVIEVQQVGAYKNDILWVCKMIY